MVLTDMDRIPRSLDFELFQAGIYIKKEVKIGSFALEEDAKQAAVAIFRINRPSITYCSFEVRHKGKTIHRWTKDVNWTLHYVRVQETKEEVKQLTNEPVRTIIRLD